MSMTNQALGKLTGHCTSFICSFIHSFIHSFTYSFHFLVMRKLIKNQGHTSAQNSAYISFAVNFVTGHSFVTEQRSQAVIINPITRSLEDNIKLVSAVFARCLETYGCGGGVQASSGVRLACALLPDNRKSIKKQSHVVYLVGQQYGLKGQSGFSCDIGLYRSTF